MLITERHCRVCQRSLVTAVDLGTLALSGFPRQLDEPVVAAPLDLCRCPACGLVQLRHSVTPDALFKQYWYKSGINETMQAELVNVVADGVAHLGQLEDGDIVVDVGANDGTLLEAYDSYGRITRLAYEPAENLQEPLSAHSDAQYMEYFPGEHLPERGSVSLLTSIACFYAVDDPMAFVSAVNDALTSHGIWIVQFQDLHQMLVATAFDDICHEHLFYPSLAAIARMVAPFDLAIIDAELRSINGGSLRLTIGRRWRPVSSRVWALSVAEYGCEQPATLRVFADKVDLTRLTIQEMVKQSGVIDLYGASTKGNTLLQVCGLGPGQIRQAWERSPEKWGRHTITGIPIVSEADGRADPPAMLFVGIWQFREAIIQREAEYLARGGRLLFPLPQVEVIDGVREHLGARSDTAAIG